MSFLRDTSLAAVSTVALAGGRFVAMAIVARKLGVEDFGVLAFSAMCVDLLVLAAMFGLPGVITRYAPVARAGERARFGRLRGLWLVATLALVAAAGPLVAAGVVGIADRALVLFVIWALVSAVQNVAVAEMHGAFRFDLYVLSSLMAGGALIAGAVLVVAPGDVETAMIALTLGPLVQSLPVLAVLFGRPAGKSVDGTPAGLPGRGRIAGFGFNQSLNGITNALVWSRGELFVVEGRLDVAAVGLYSAAVALIGLVWRMLSMLNGAAAPHLAARLHDPAQVAALVEPMTRLSMACCGAVAVALAVLGEPIAVLVFGDKFAGTGDLLVLMAPGAAVAGNGLVLLTVHYMSNARVTRDALIVASLVLLALAWAMVGRFGAEGAALARTAVLIGVSAAMPLWLIGQGHAAFGRRLLAELLSVVGLVGAASAFVLAAEPGLWPRLLLGTAAAYGLLARATGTLRPHRLARNAVGMLRNV